MNVFLLALWGSLAAATAQGVHQPTCIAPKNNPNAPVGVIYLHGFFEPTGNDSSYIQMEKNNRQQLQALADQLGVRIAVPIATKTKRTRKGKEVRDWLSEGSGTGSHLKAIEAKASAACNAPLAKPRALLGFSQGGYTVREIAFNCAASRSDYSVIMAIGAKAQAPSGRQGGYGDCAKFVAGVAKGDIHTDPNFQSNGSAMLKTYVKQGGSGFVLDEFAGGHVLPPNSVLANEIGKPGGQPVSTPTQSPQGKPLFAR